MKKKIVISAIAVGLLSSVNVYGAEDLSSMFSEGKTSGQIRSFYVDREYQGTAGTDTHRNSFAIGGHLKFETADYKGLSFGAAFYTTNEIDWLNYNGGNTPSETDPSLLGPNLEGYSILGEAYLQYKFGNTTFKGGRQKLNTPLAGADDARMLPNLFEAYVLTNKDIKDTTITLGHLSKFAQGTFGSVYGAGGIFSATGGYSNVDAAGQVGKFVNMGTYAVGQSTDGVTLASATYTGVEGLKLQLWDYYAHDIVNSIYAQADYKMNIDSIKPFASAQIIKQSDVGDKLLGDLNGMLVGVQAGVSVGSLTVSAAYTQTSKNDATDAPEANAIVTLWGGMPSFTQGMVTRHMNLAGTKATKIAGSYSFKEMGTNLTASAYYTSFDMDENSGGGIARTATEPGFDLTYNPQAVKKLQLKFRGNFPRDMFDNGAGSKGWSEYRVIANYNF